VLSRRVICVWGGGDERWEVRRRISSRSEVGRCFGSGWVFVDFEVAGLGEVSRLWRAVMRMADFEARVWDVLRAFMLILV
jgi:hypothetical protein